MTDKGEQNKWRAIVMLLTLGGGASVFAAASLLENSWREQTKAAENKIRNSEIDDGSQIPSRNRPVLPGARRAEPFGLSPAMRGSLADKGFSIVMEKTGADGTDIQARAAGSAALIAFCSDVLDGRLEYEIGSMKISLDEKAAASLEISSNGK